MTATTKTPLHSDMMIKICGMKDAANLSRIATLTPMLMGFIFYSKSLRYAGALDPEAVRNLPTFVRPVGVFVDCGFDEIDYTCRKYGIGIVQLHGSESTDLCRKLKDAGYVVFKAVGVDDSIDWNSLRPYTDLVTMFVFDTSSQEKGGTGRKFDWELLKSYTLSTPYLLSGGIGPDDIPGIVSAMRPGMAGIDINSRFETEPGIKDMKKLIEFILKLRQYNEKEPSTIPFWEKR